MVSPISSAIQPAVQPAEAAKTPSAATQKAQPAATDTVQLNNTAKVVTAAAAALKEATETSVQTNREANAGDIQARNLLAREVAAKNL